MFLQNIEKRHYLVVYLIKSAVSRGKEGRFVRTYRTTCLEKRESRVKQRERGAQ
jgi:hypothetical protein